MSVQKTKPSGSDISIVLCGGAGQGIQTIEFILTHVLKTAGYHVFACKEYMSRIRGGSNSTLIRVASRPVGAYTDRIDLLIPLETKALEHVAGRVSGNTVIIGEKEILKTDRPLINVPFTTMAKEIGSPLYANTIAVGVVLGLFLPDTSLLDGHLKKQFAKKGDETIQKNQAAGRQGFDIGKQLQSDKGLVPDISRNPDHAGELLVNGSEAVGLGALAGGCNFVASYPMSPSTGVLTFLSQHAAEFGLIAEQAEDEISAVNMGIGAWYAGARALTTTSGGGFALMSEGVSLAGMLETPMVIYLAQRPGPATGLPTRTEQGDLDLVLYAGHGEFPRIILAPRSLEDAFYLSQKAFNLADKYQSPVFILSDQFLVDAMYNTPRPNPERQPNKSHVVITTADYKRYLFTDTGLSPRGIPGRGQGLVCVDSDTHDEEGHIIEDPEVRDRMTEKRFRKAAVIRRETAPTAQIPDKVKNLVISWGSTFFAVQEAIDRAGREDLANLHFSQVYPLPEDLGAALEKAEKVVAVENNATGQFARLVHRETGRRADELVLKSNGMPFSVEEITEKFKAL